MTLSLQVVLIFTALRLISSLVQQNSFHPVTDCVCPQDVVTYECTVCGLGLATVWEGTTLDSCSGGEITLTNRDFMDPIMATICSGGRIAARGIVVEDGCFTSQLNVTFNATALQGRSVRCSVDNGTHASEVGRDILTLTTDPYLPPNNVQLVGVSPAGLLFSWNQTQNCPSLRYNINQSETCGRCPNTTTGTSVNCSDFTLSNSINLCTFAVQAVICGNNGVPLLGNFSDFITVNLTVPTINEVTVIPHYHTDNGLRSLTVLFSEVDPFLIYKGINGTVNSYMVYYTDSDTEELCGSNKIYCDQGKCSTEFDVSSVSSCRPSSDINVTISAMTSLGEGPLTVPIMEEYRNNFVSVQAVSESVSITCAFLNVTKETVKSCNATITYGDNCQDQILINGVRDSDNDSVVLISLRSFLEETMSSKYCAFRVNATAGMRTATVEGSLLAIISINNPISNRNDIIVAAVVPIVFLIALVCLIIFGFSLIMYYFKVHYRSAGITDIPMQSVNTKFQIITVSKECNMIDFAKENFDNYDPDSGNGYYQFIKSAEEYIPPKAQVLLVSEDKRRLCSNRQAHKIIGISDKREKVKLPDLSKTEWKYAFIQSTSHIRTLPEGSLFMYYKVYDDPETKRARTPLKQKETEENLKRVEDKYIKLKKVPGDREYPVLEFAKTMAPHYNPGLGYGFYEFTKPEFILYDKQVIMMNKNNELYYGSDACRMIGIRPGQSYDESKEFEPKFDKKRWKCAFIQTRSNVRNLQPDTWFLYCDVASSEMIKVLEPNDWFTVTKSEQKLIEFAKEKVKYYNPRAGYGYYEFAEPGYVLSKRNIMVLTKNGELFTGPGVRHLIGATGNYDETEMINPPDFSNDDCQWECIFIQGKRAYGRLLPKNTRFLYCEYDYHPEDY